MIDDINDDVAAIAAALGSEVTEVCGRGWWSIVGGSVEGWHYLASVASHIVQVAPELERLHYPEGINRHLLVSCVLNTLHERCWPQDMSKVTDLVRDAWWYLRYLEQSEVQYDGNAAPVS